MTDRRDSGHRQPINKILTIGYGIIIVLFGLLIFANPTLAITRTTNSTVAHLGWAKIKNGYTVSSASGDIRMEVTPKIFPRPATVTVKRASPKKTATLKSPDGLKRVSPIYEYDVNIDPIAFFDNRLALVLKYKSMSANQREVRFWSSSTKSWLPLSSSDLSANQEIRTYVHFPFSKVAVFERKSVFVGRASWYDTSNRSMSASTDLYSIGTKVRVTNTENNKAVTVVIHSTWAGVDGRVIDLTRDAFAALGDVRQGTLPVRVEPAVISTPNPISTPGGVPLITAVSAIVIDPTTDRLIYEKNLQSRPIASITKLMTALVVLDAEPANRELTYDEALDNADGSSIPLSHGDTLAFDEALKASLISSANNATKLLARSTGLSNSEFVKRMNQKAKDIQMNFTRFVEPTGLDIGNTSTPGDVAKLIQAALKKNVIRALTSDSFDQISKNTGKTSEKIINLNSTNHILNRGLPIVGGKTGYLGIGNANFALKLVASGKERIVVVLGCTSGSTRNEDMMALAKWALTQG